MQDRKELAEEYWETMSKSFMDNARELVSDLENATYTAFLEGYDAKKALKWKKIDLKNIHFGYLFLHKDNYIVRELTKLYNKEQNNLTHYITIDDLLNLERE